ncbi:glycosyltransferase family 2 protein [Micromonospora okii]|uniref:glycosyltransferase family 2 protein n=1 Tax=Micromonospora okii TaxID=1182970 RepID=UPI001E441E58|nr:glycosyltransferase family 2 protein [Micromonospora okii]
MSDLRPARALGRLLLGHFRRHRDRGLQDVATGALRQASDRTSWVVAILNLTLRVRRWLHHVCYLAPRRAATRLRYHGPGPEPAVHRTMSLLCPTRSRPDQAALLLRSLSGTAVAPQRVEVLFYVDADDPDLAVYRELAGEAPRRFPRLGGCVLVVGEPIGVPAAWNVLAATASGDLLMMANDDQRYVDYGWDVALDARVGELVQGCPDEVLCLYFDGGQYGERGRDFPIVTRAWYDALGYFVPEIFSQWEVETWVFDIAERMERLICVPGVFVEHLHYHDYKAPFDATYQRHSMTREKSFADHALFLRTLPQRLAEVTKLRAMAGTRADGASADGARGGAPLDSAGLWFVDHLADSYGRVAEELDRWLTASDASWDADGGPSTATGTDWRRTVLFRDGAWTAVAESDLPLLRDVLAAIPEATLPPDTLIDLAVLNAGGAAPVALPGHPGTTVVWALRVPSGTEAGAGDTRVVWSPGQCLLFPAAPPVVVRCGGDGELVVLRWPSVDGVRP